MKSRPRIRKTIKWGGAAVTMLLVVAWIGSAIWYVGYEGAGRAIRLMPGGVVWVSAKSTPAGPSPVYWESHAQLLGERWKWWIEQGSVVRFDWLFVPLWLPAVIASIAAAFAWRLDAVARRRLRSQLCSTCRYDRAGIGAEAVCPECGKLPTP
jgi:hypothetical protein